METLTLPAQPHPEVASHQATITPVQEQLNPVAMAQLDTITVPDATESTPPLTPTETAVPQEARISRIKRVWRTAGKLAVREGLGAAVDVALLAVGPGSVSTREVMASTFDMGVANVQGQQEQSPETIKLSRHRRLGRAVVNFALGVGTAVMAQKYGPEMVDHINSNLNNGVGEMLVPIASKLGALGGVNKARRMAGL